MGLESGDPEMRFKYLKRNMTDEMIINCSKWFHKYGISQFTYNIIGLPHEDIHRALKTIKLNARIKSDRTIANIFYPYPGTKLYDIAKGRLSAGRHPARLPRAAQAGAVPRARGAVH